MGAMQNFAFEEHLVRVVHRDGEPWFVANDVCRALDLSNPRKAVADLDDDEKGVTTGDTLGGFQSMNIVSEPGVYRLVFRSRKPEAERFKRWLAHEVLPAIRRTGAYVPETTDDGAPAATRSLMPSPLGAQVALLNWITKGRGFEVAAAYMVRIGLPPLPPRSESLRYDRTDGPEALAALLACDLGGMTVAEALRSGADDALAAFGIRRMQDGFFVSNTAEGVERGFSGTAWSEGEWRRALLSLPGARRHGTVRFGAHQAKAVWVPL